MSEPIPAGSTDQTIDVFLQDSSSSTGAGLTGLLYNTSGLTCYYRKGATGTSTQLTLATQTVGGAHSDGGFVEIDSTNQPGMYRLDLSDTIVASEGYVTIYLQGAANLLPTPIRVDVVSATRGLAGTALPAAAADAAGGLIVSDAGGLDADTLLGTLTSLAAETKNATVLDRFKEIFAVVESQRQRHTGQGNVYFVAPNTGDTHANGNRGGWTDPYNSIQDCHDNAVTDSNHDVIILVSDAAAGVTTLTENITLSKRYLQIRGPGRDFILAASTNTDTVTISADGVGLEGFRIQTTGAGSGKGIAASGRDFIGIRGMWFENTRGDSIELTNCTNAVIESCNLQGSGQAGSGDGISIVAGAGQNSSYCRILNNYIEDTAGDGIIIDTTGGGTITSTSVIGNKIFNCTGAGIDIADSGVADTVVADNRFAGNALDYTNASTTATYTNNEDILDAIWLDTVAGDDGDPGIPSQPVATIARAKTLASDLNKVIKVVGGSSFTLASSFAAYRFEGHDYALALGGQDITGAFIFQSTAITGTGTGTNGTPFTIQECSMGTASLGAYGFLEKTAIGGTLTLTSTAGVTADSINLFNCFSGVAGAGAPTITASGVTKTTNIQTRNWFGGLTGVLNSDCVWSHEVTLGGTQTFTNAGGTLELRGSPKAVSLTTSGSATSTLVIPNGCPITIEGTGGTVNLYGQIGPIDNNSTGVTVNIYSNVKLAAGVASGTPTTTTFDVAETLTADQFNDCVIMFTSGAAANQPRSILDNTTSAITVSEAFTTAPSAGDNYAIYRDHIHPVSQIQSGLATSAEIAALNDISVADLLTTAMTESYSADGAAPTLTQAVMLILQHLSESSISGTTKTVKKLDGISTAATFALDDATTPTSVTRAT